MKTSITNFTSKKSLGFIVFLTLLVTSVPLGASILASRINMLSHNHNQGSGKTKNYDAPIVEWHEDLDMFSVIFVCDEYTEMTVECSDGGILTQFPITTDGWENYYWVGTLYPDIYTIIIENDYAHYEGELIIS